MLFRSFRVGALCLALAACGDNRGPGPTGHTILIDIDDHGLAGLWMANAPNIKGLIARGTLAFSRVDVPTHSNQNNYTLLTGQYPDGHNVPANGWLSRAHDFTNPVSIPGIGVGDYALYGVNPLLTRGDSVYRAVRAAGGRSVYVGELPPFEVGADEVHLAINGVVAGTALGTLELDTPTTKALLMNVLQYPQSVVDGYHYEGPPAKDETQLHFTFRAAADYVRATDAGHPLPPFMFVWDFIALDDDPTGKFGADGAALAKVIEDYDDGLGLLLSALADEGLLDTTNILFTLDHGKVDTHNQVVLGTHGDNLRGPADGQLAAVVAARGAEFGLTTADYALLNEDGDAQLYARVPGAGTAAGAAAQTDVAHKLVALVQSGAIEGVDTTRTMTADGFMGTRTFHDARASGPNQPDVIVFPKDDWTLNQVDATNAVPGPFKEHTEHPFARHGGFTTDELYVPLIMAGPAFKQGVVLPHPVEHADVAPTALATLGGGVQLATAARGPIRAALVDDPGETIALPDPPTRARDVVLEGSGFQGTPLRVAEPPTRVVVIDVAGLYEDEVFNDPTLAEAANGLRSLAAVGTRFEDCWARSRDWPVTEHQMLTGGYPMSPFVPMAEDDPTQTFAPGAGLLAMPPPRVRVADRAAFDAWRAPTPFPGESLFDAARALGFSTALLGEVDYHALHIDTAAVNTAASLQGLAEDLATFAAATPKALAVVALGGERTANRHDAAAIRELGAISTAVTGLAQRLPGALIVITSRGASPIDSTGADFYGPGSSRHVPLILLGPGVRAGVVSGQPATPADIPATILFALGAPTTTDLSQGTWATGAPVAGVPQPTPNHATEGHALVRAFVP